MKTRTGGRMVAVWALAALAGAASARGGLSAGRVWKVTGPAFIGNRLVLRADVGGADLSAAEYVWTRDGKVVGDGERLEIASLEAEDFGTYQVSVRTPEYPKGATSAAYELKPAASGVPVGWGADGHGRTEAPEGESGFVQVASGMNFNVGLKQDGTVTAWGYDGHGACDVPEGLSGVSSVAAGGYDSAGAGFAVKTDGSVTGWGRSYCVESYGYWEWQENPETGEWEETDTWIEETYTNGVDLVASMPEGLSDVVKVAVGGNYAVALSADGTVAAWGVGAGENVPGDLADVVDIAAGGSVALALKADGTVAAWGEEWSAGGALVVPEGLEGASAVAATKVMWGGDTGFALESDGTLVAWGDEWDYGLTAVPDSESGWTAVDGGQYHAMALDAKGMVAVWGETWYDQDDVPAEVQGNAVAIAAGGYHCTAILPDGDGDTIADAVEPLYGRDPAVWEDWHKTSLTGTVQVDGGAMMPQDAKVSVFDAQGNFLAGAEVDETTGRYEAEGLLPGRYFVFVEAANAADDWADHVAAPWLLGELELPPDSPWSFGSAPVAVGELTPDCDFDLAPGQAHAWCRVAPLKQVGEGVDAESEEAELPKGTIVYLDLWPVETDAEGRFDLGEVAASHAMKVEEEVTPPHPMPHARNGRSRSESDEAWVPLPHTVSYKDPKQPDKRPAIDNQVRGVEGYLAKSHPVVSPKECSVKITTQPGGVEVWIDRADEPLGATPLTVSGLSAGSHALLLRKDGYLRPRPIELIVEPDEPTDVTLELHAAGGGIEPVEIEVDAGMPETPIYLDYLPTGLTTPARVGGMDPTEAEGLNWRSVSHSILLRREGSRPYAPRMVPEEASGGSSTIIGANEYDDDDGDGVRNDREVEAGRDPSDAGNGGRGPVAVITNRLSGGVTRLVRVPVSWVARQPGFHGRFQGVDDAEARLGLARDILLKENAKNGRFMWDCYVAGLDPEDPDDDLRVDFEWKDGRFAFSWSPDYEDDAVEPRVYTIESCDRLTGDNGEDVWKADGDAKKSRAVESGAKFYRVNVSLPDNP